MSAAENKAVFLSYASQDAPAVERIAEALRVTGVEVWFDKNELVGGDQWDQKIRGQVKACALFVPVISAATQARLEGYFRLEWRLAASRTHTMADAKPFLLPVVIDATRDADAHVPEEFRAVQWTRLVGGETPAKFCERVKKLLGGEAASASSRPVADAREAPVRRGIRVPWVRAAMVGIVLALATWQPWKKPAPKPVGPTPIPSMAAQPLTDAGKLVAQARALFEDGDQSNHENFFLADDLLKRALTPDPTDGEVWAAQAQLSALVYFFTYDRSTARRDAMRVQAERAIKLAPDSFEAQLAMGDYLALGDVAATAEAIRLLTQLAERAPNDRRVFQTLGAAYSYARRIDEAVAAFDRGNAVPGGDPEGLGMKAGQLLWHGRYAEMEEANAQSLARRPVGRALMLDVLIKLNWRGDLDGAAQALARWPQWLRLEDRGCFIASQVWIWRHEPDKAVAALNAVTHEFLNDALFVGPKAGLLALAHEMANRPQAARAEWENARKAAARAVLEDPANKLALAWKAIALARLGETAEAESLLRELEQTGDLRSDFWSCGAGGALLRIALGHGDEVVAKFNSDQRSAVVRGIVVPSPRAALRLNPVFDSIRATPEFQKWMAAAPAPKPQEASANAAVKPNEKSVAVLAFANLSDDKGNEIFSDGISEELINVLGRVPGLTVKGRASSFYFKGSTATAQEKGRKLGATFLVDGSVRKSGNTVRITAQLSRAATDELVWSSDPLVRDLKDVWAVQEEIAGLIAKALSLKLGVASVAQTASMNPEAYRLYLEGRQAWNLRTPVGFDQAEALFNRALVLEPKFARAHAALADVGAVGVSETDRERRAVLRAKIVAHAEQAIALDPGLAEPHATLGLLENSDWNFEAADRHFQRAFALNRSYAWAHLWRAQGLTTQGRMDEALAENQQALEADPLASRIASNTALLLLLAGRPADALAFADRSLSLLPGELQAPIWKTEALLMLGREGEALTIAREALAINPSRRAFTYVLARAGNPQEVAAAVSAPDPRFANQTRALLATGQVNEAFARLEADARGSVFSFQFMLFHPAFDTIRKDPRFEKMLERLSMTDAHARAQAWRATHPPEKPEAKK